MGLVLRERAGVHVKKIRLELGGKRLQIVVLGADLAVAAAKIVWGTFHCSRQACVVGRRLIVHESVADALLEKVAGFAGQIVTGDPNGGTFHLQHYAYQQSKVLASDT